MTLIRLACALALLGLLAGCDDQGSYPSLQKRPIEGIMDRPVTPTLVPPAQPNTERAARIASLLDQAEKADREFRAAQAETERAISAAAGAPAGDERWIVAQQQLSRLETARAPVGHALADLDALQIKQANSESEGMPSAEAEALASAYARVTQIDEDERSVLGRLTKALGS
jgi:hypothetical protein